MTYEEYAEKRDSLGLTNGKVARYSGVSTATLSQWKNGVYEPKFQTLAKIKHLLDTYDPEYELNYYIKTMADGEELVITPTQKQNTAATMRRLFMYDSLTTLFEHPVELTQSEYEELKKAASAYVDSWISMHKVDFKDK